MQRRNFLKRGGNLLLDLYPNASAAYSLRYLKSSFKGNSVIRVRRSSDNAEQDFTSSQLTDGTLTTFCGVGDGFVKTWYDQSGNLRDAINLSQTNQPQIVFNGAVNLLNSLPAIEFSKSRLSTLSLASQLLIKSSFTVSKYNTANSANYVYGSQAADGATQTSGLSLASSGGTTTGLSIFNAAVGVSLDLNNAETSKQELDTFITDDVDSFLSIQGNSLTNVGTSLDIYLFTLGSRAKSISAVSLDGDIQEAIFYPTNQTVNKSDIETDINNYYSIY